MGVAARLGVPQQPALAMNAEQRPEGRGGVSATWLPPCRLHPRCPGESRRARSAAAGQSCVCWPGFSASFPASGRLHLRSGFSRVVYSALLLEAACHGPGKGVSPVARAGCLCQSCWGQFCEWQMCVSPCSALSPTC